MNEQNKCPVMHGGIKHTTFGVRSNRDWWPKQLNLKILHQNSALSNPMGPAFNYAEAFKTVDLEELRKDPFRADDGFAGMVAGRLWPLRPVLHPHGMAQRRYLPYR